MAVTSKAVCKQVFVHDNRRDYVDSYILHTSRLSRCEFVNQLAEFIEERLKQHDVDLLAQATLEFSKATYEPVVKRLRTLPVGTFIGYTLRVRLSDLFFTTCDCGSHRPSYDYKLFSESTLTLTVTLFETQDLE